jgi:hypothetical protein
MSIYCLDQARVTPSGILFNGKYYSSKMAIKNKWYEHALLCGDSNISIAYRHSTLGIVITIMYDHDLEEAHCLNGFFQITEGDKQKYQSDLRLLKEKWNMQISNKDKSTRRLHE